MNYLRLLKVAIIIYFLIVIVLLLLSILLKLINSWLKTKFIDKIDKLVKDIISLLLIPKYGMYIGIKKKIKERLFQKLFKSILTLANRVMTYFFDKVPVLGIYLIKKFKKIMNYLIHKLVDLSGFLIKNSKYIFGKIADTLKSIWNSISGVVTVIANSIWNIIKTIGTYIGKKFMNFYNKIIEPFVVFCWKIMKKIGKMLLEYVIEPIYEAIKYVTLKALPYVLYGLYKYTYSFTKNIIIPIVAYIWRKTKAFWNYSYNNIILLIWETIKEFTFVVVITGYFISVKMAGISELFWDKTKITLSAIGQRIIQLKDEIILQIQNTIREIYNSYFDKSNNDNTKN